MNNVAIGLSLLFFVIGLFVTERNAKYILSGYNMMSEADKKKIDLKNYLHYFKRFHVFLGISFYLLWSIFNYLVNEISGGIFLVIYPILAYIFFMLTSSKYTQGIDKTQNIIGIFILTITLFLVSSLFFYQMQDNDLIIEKDGIKINGSYGETLKSSEIKKIELVNQIPLISYKTKGFALSSIKKGYFKTKKGENIKLFVNSNNQSVILITKMNGERIYFSSKVKSNPELLHELKKSFPHITKKQL